MRWLAGAVVWHWQPGRRTASVLVTLLVWASTVTLMGQVPPRVADEYGVKAAFVYRFLQFVTWPTPALEAATLDLCVLRPSALGRQLEPLVRGEAVSGRALRVLEVAGADKIAGCHALFVGAEAAAARDVLQAVGERPVLTVGESERFLDDGGIIALRVVDRRVRFDVDMGNARKAGLRIAPQLLNLAVVVRGGRS